MTTEYETIYVESIDQDVEVEYTVYRDGVYDDDVLPDEAQELIVIEDPEFKYYGLYDADGEDVEPTTELIGEINKKMVDLYWDNGWYKEG